MLADMLAKSYVNYFCRSNLLKISSKKGQHVSFNASTDEIWKEKVCIVGHICKGKGLGQGGHLSALLHEQ